MGESAKTDADVNLKGSVFAALKMSPVEYDAVDSGPFEAGSVDADTVDVQPEACDPPPPPLFSPGQAVAAAFFGGFVGGFLIIATTLWRLQRRVAAALVALAAPAILYALYFIDMPGLANVASLPERKQIWIVGLTAMMCTWLLAKCLYGRAYREYAAQGHRPASAFVACTLGLVCGLMALWGIRALHNNQYGEFLARPHGRGVYYFAGVSRIQAFRVAEALENDSRMGDGKWNAQVGKGPDNRYWLAVIVDPPAESEADKSQFWRFWVELGADQAGKAFDDRLREVRLCDVHFRPWKTLRIAGHETWNRHYAEGDAQLRKNDFAAAEQAYRKAVEVAETFGEDDYRLVLSLTNLGTCLQVQERPAEAEAELRRAVRIGRQGLGEKSYEIGWALDRLARVVEERGNAADAESLFREAYDVRQVYPGDDATDLHASATSLAELLAHRGRHAEAETVYRQLLARLEQVEKPEQSHVAAALDGLASTLLDQRKPADAEAAYRRALSIYEKHPEQDDSAIAATLAGLGAALYNQRNYAAAEEAYRRRLSLQEKLSGVGTPATFEALYELAMACHARQSFIDAETFYQRALDSDQPSDPSRRMRSASIYLNLGNVCAAQERYRDAEMHFRRALKAYETEVEPVFRAKTGMRAYYGLGDMAARRDPREAEASYLRALYECEKLKPFDEEMRSRILFDLAVVCRTQSSHRQADQYFRRSVEWFEKKLGSSDPTVVAMRLAWAGNCSEWGRADQAEELLTKSVRGLETAKGRDDLSVADAVTELGLFLSSRGRIEEAETQFRRAVAIREKTLGPQDPSLAGAFEELAGVAEQKGDFAESAAQLAKLIGVLEKSLGKDHIVLATVLDKQAQLLRKIRRIPESIKAEQRAKGIREKNEQRSPEAPFGESRGVG